MISHLFAFLEHEKSSYQLNFEEKCQLVVKKREEGNEFFKKGRFAVALRKYKKAIEVMPTDSGDEQKTKVQELKIPCHLNYAICLIKEKNWKDALEQTDKVLEIDSKNIKGLYRKGLVLTGMDRWDEALKILNEAKALDPTNTAIQQEIQKLKNKIAQHNKKEANLFKNLFQRIDQIEQEENKEKEQRMEAEKALRKEEPVKEEPIKEESVKEEPTKEEING